MTWVTGRESPKPQVPRQEKKQFHIRANDYLESENGVYTTKVVGVTFEGRQSIITHLTKGEQILLVREPSNPFDNNAIKVCCKNGSCFGYIKKDLAARIASLFDSRGGSVFGTVVSVKEGNDPNQSLGVIIRFLIS